MTLRWNAAGPAALSLLLAGLPLSCSGAPASAAPASPEGEVPAPVPGMEAALAVVERAVETGSLSGAVVLIGQGERRLALEAYGVRVAEGQGEASQGEAGEEMTTDTVFDLASLTKTVATAPSIMALVAAGELSLQDPVAMHLPAFAAGGKQDVTVEDLLLHRSGLPPANSLAEYADGPEVAWQRLLATPIDPESPEFVYSDIGYLVLGRLVEELSGRTLDAFAREAVFAPLGMEDTGYAVDPARCAPTERPGEEEAHLRGIVHDPRARALGGVAGHAGLFGTAEDLERFARMLLGQPQPALDPGAVAELTRPRWFQDGEVARALGLDVVSRFDSPRGGFPSGSSFGHTGFTGTSMWVDPTSGAHVILLTSRLYPDGLGRVGELRRELSREVASILAPAPGGGTPAVRTGIDVLVAEDFERLRGRRLALLTNASAVDSSFRRTLDLLHAAEGLELVRCLTPEHGFGADAEGDIEDGRDAATGVELRSLYGATRRPTEEMLEGIDALVFDVQDVGTRFYTYATTLGYAMEECGQRGVEVIVLDRPNPLGGELVSGPRTDEELLRFISYKPIPLVHGLTMGELAGLFRGEYGVECELSVVELEGWRRRMRFEDTGLPWRNPSPNMRSATQALLYPGVGLLEACNLSVGRGTDQPFERLGAPWIDGPRLGRALQEIGLRGLEVTPIQFTPDASRFEGELCQGIQLLVRERSEVQPVELGFQLAWTLQRLFPDDFEAEKVLDRLLAEEAFLALRSAPGPGPFAPLWARDVSSFREQRLPYLLYR